MRRVIAVGALGAAIGLATVPAAGAAEDPALPERFCQWMDDATDDEIRARIDEIRELFADYLDPLAGADADRVDDGIAALRGACAEVPASGTTEPPATEPPASSPSPSSEAPLSGRAAPPPPTSGEPPLGEQGEPEPAADDPGSGIDLGPGLDEESGFGALSFDPAALDRSVGFADGGPSPELGVLGADSQRVPDDVLAGSVTPLPIGNEEFPWPVAVAVLASGIVGTLAIRGAAMRAVSRER